MESLRGTEVLMKGKQFVYLTNNAILAKIKIGRVEKYKFLAGKRFQMQGEAITAWHAGKPRKYKLFLLGILLSN